MSKINDILAALEWFRGRRIDQLAKPRNVAKSDWREVEVDDYLRQIAEQLSEFQVAKSQSVHGPMIDRCADIANLAMFLAAKIANEKGVAEV